MTALLLAMLRARAGLALTTFALAMFAVAAAVTAPLYAAAAARATVAVGVGSAPVSERMLTADRLDADGPSAEVTVLERQPRLTGFETLAGEMVNGRLETTAGTMNTWLVARSRTCEHVVLAEGRCPSADREVMVRDDLAAELGDRVTFHGLSFGGGPITGSVPLTVVGLYKPYVPTDPHWAERVILSGVQEVPAFTTARTVAAVTGAPLLRTTDLIASPEAFADRDRLAEEVDAATAILEAAGYQPTTEIEALSRRLDEAAEVLAASFLVASLPLVVICWYVLLLAVVGAVEQRRGELAVIALRGVPDRMRWMLSAGETLSPVLAGLIPGLLLGYATAAVLARAFLPGQPEITVTALALGLAALAVCGAAAAVLAAQRGAMRQPILRLLRRIHRRSGPVVRIVEAVVVVLALATGYQAATAAGLGGIALLAPVCVGLGCGMLAGRLLLAPAEPIGRWWVRRGRITLGLAALSLSRRPGARAMVTLLTVGFGMLGFALIANDTAERAWSERARLETGAPRVVVLSQVQAGRLVEAVRRIDPQGRFAMAVARLPQDSGPPVLAVDTTRLAAVAYWPDEAGAATAAQSLRPVAPAPIRLQSDMLHIAATLHEIDPDTRARIEVTLLGSDGRRTTEETDWLTLGAGEYTAETPACADSPCRLVQLNLGLATHGPHRVRVTLTAVSDSAGRTVVGLSDAAAWWQPQPSTTRPVGRISAGAQGLTISADSPLSVDLTLRPVVVPVPIPVVAAGPAPERLSAVGGPVAVSAAGSVPLLPRVGGHGLLVDLEYVDLTLNPRDESMQPEVWLGPQAPGNVLDLLREAGLGVEQDINSDDRHALFRHQAPALALHFQRLAAVVTLLLAAAGLLVAAMLERSRREESLSALLPQGLPRRHVQFGALFARWAVVLAAATAGLATAVAMWLLARPVIPVFSTATATLPAPVWPGPVVPAALLAALLFFMGTAWAAARLSQNVSEGGGQ